MYIHTTSCEYAHVHSMSTLTIKLLEILLSGIRGVALTNCFSSISHFGKISKFKRGIIPRKKNLNQNFLLTCKTIHSMCLITRKFHKILLSSFRVVTVLTKKNRTDGLTDMQTGQKHYILYNLLRDRYNYWFH